MNPAPHQPITFSKQGGLPSHHQSWVKWMSAEVTQRTEDMSSMGRGRKARIGKDLPGCLLFYSYDFPITSSTLKPLPCSQRKHDCVLLFYQRSPSGPGSCRRVPFFLSPLALTSGILCHSWSCFQLWAEPESQSSSPPLPDSPFPMGKA